jgi:hypothetical protein
MKRLLVPRHYISPVLRHYTKKRIGPNHTTNTERNHWMKRICLILLFCATAFGESNYEKGRLISITDVSKVTQTVSYYGGTPSAYRVKEFRYRLSVQVGDTVYIGLYMSNIFKPYYPVLDFRNNSDVEVRIEGGRMHIMRAERQRLWPID